MEVIRELCSFQGRGSGTDAERRAANLLAGRLRTIGRRAQVEPFFAHPQYAIVHLIHAALGVAGSIVSMIEPAIGFGLVFLAAVSTYLDLNTRLYLVRSLLFRRVSQNIVSRAIVPRLPPASSSPPTTTRPGPATSSPRPPIASASYRSVSGSARPLPPLLLARPRPLLPILGARMAGVDATWLSAMQAIPTIVLIVAAFLLIDIALSDIVPGAYDNASGVAAVLSAADDCTTPPENLDVWVVLTGSEESFCEGMRAFVRRPERSSTATRPIRQPGFGLPRHRRLRGAKAR